MSGETILVVEDEPSVARGLEYGLKAEGFTVLMADNGKKALDLARGAQGPRSTPQLMLLDVRLPDMSGFDVCRALREEGRTLPILMVTARDEEVDKVVGLELGADDYIVKPFSFRELVSRVRAALRRAYGELASAAGGERVAFGDVRVDLSGMRVTRGERGVPLTPTEYRLLRQLVTHPEQVFSRDSLLELVWGYESSVDSQRTVDVHMRHLREKLEEDPANPRWLITVRGTGYMFTQKRNVNEV
ncbi:MAG TPA: response regulator transcription factor [Spirochaetia bacterium]|nr:response regulator transcription factor [Spirochaetia bacterium]